MIEGKDGVTHINIYTKGESVLGKWMSNLADSPFMIEGKTFKSLEGYWYYLGLPNIPEKEALTNVNGFQAKKLGKELRAKYNPVQLEDFEVRIKKAILCKLLAYPDMVQALSESTLPFTHYYEYNGKRIKAGFEWITQFWEGLRYVLPVFQLVMPFGSSSCWDEYKGITDTEEYTDKVFKVWFDEYLSGCKAKDVLDTFHIMGEDIDDFLEGWINQAGIDLTADTWGMAYSKLNKHTSFDLMGYWLRWPQLGNELMFKYELGSNKMEVCLGLMLYLIDVILTERKLGPYKREGAAFKQNIPCTPSIAFEAIPNTIAGVLGKSDKPWLS